MPASTGTAKTDHASKYLQQLCKHWSHKFTVEFDPTQGTVPFSDTAKVHFKALDGKLEMDLSAESDERLEHLKKVVDDHLKRFAFREELQIDWS